MGEDWPWRWVVHPVAAHDATVVSPCSGDRPLVAYDRGAGRELRPDNLWGAGRESCCRGEVLRP
eukprot:14238622-Heterocapsa_arctica.AAC.1